jgi:hypothetical protein
MFQYIAQVYIEEELGRSPTKNQDSGAKRYLRDIITLLQKKAQTIAKNRVHSNHFVE